MRKLSAKVRLLTLFLFNDAVFLNERVGFLGMAFETSHDKGQPFTPLVSWARSKVKVSGNSLNDSVQFTSVDMISIIYRVPYTSEVCVSHRQLFHENERTYCLPWSLTLTLAI